MLNNIKNNHFEVDTLSVTPLNLTMSGAGRPFEQGNVFGHLYTLKTIYTENSK